MMVVITTELDTQKTAVGDQAQLQDWLEGVLNNYMGPIGSTAYTCIIGASLSEPPH